MVSKARLLGTTAFVRRHKPAFSNTHFTVKDGESYVLHTESGVASLLVNRSGKTITLRRKGTVTVNGQTYNVTDQQENIRGKV
jgi:ABC-type dipeptide/oligopeptide/nickel transport system ATPase subunit